MVADGPVAQLPVFPVRCLDKFALRHCFNTFDERIDQKIFHAEIVVDSAKVSAEMKAYQPIPVIADFTNEDGSDNLKETIEANYKRVKQEILSLVKAENERIKSNPKLCHLIKN